VSTFSLRAVLEPQRVILILCGLLNVDQYLIKKISELQILKWQSYSIIAEAFSRNFNFEIPLEIEKDIVMEN